MSTGLEVGVNYVNKTTIVITKIDYSEVIKLNLKSETVKTSIKILTGNGYNVVKNKITENVNDYIIGASGMYATFSGTDDNENYMFKVLQNTTLINTKTNEGIIVPMNAKLIVSKSSSNKYMFKKISKLINNNNGENGELQTTVNKIVNKTYDTITNIGKAESVSPPPLGGSGGRKKSRKSRKSYKSRKSHKKMMTYKNNRK